VQLGPRRRCALTLSTLHSVIALASWCIGVITLVSTRVMYPLHLDARANDPRVSLRALDSPLLACMMLNRLRSRTVAMAFSLYSIAACFALRCSIYDNGLDGMDLFLVLIPLLCFFVGQRVSVR
jgi:hypothetical protein